VSVGLCPRCESKTARVINAKLGRDTVHGSCSVRNDRGVKRSKVKVTRLSYALPAWTCMSISLLKFSSLAQHRVNVAS